MNMDPFVMRDCAWSESKRALPLAGAPRQPEPGQPALIPSEEQQAQLQTLSTEASERGYSEGREAAQRECAEELQRRMTEQQAEHDVKLSELEAVMGRVRTLIQALELERLQLPAEAEATVLELVFACVTKVLGESAVDPALIGRVVKAATQEMGTDQPLRIRIAAEDHALLAGGGRLAELGTQAEFIADPTLTPGSCHIGNQRGELDASLETQMQAFKALLSGLHARGAAVHE